ncbi:MAG TPA: DUF559 domain-containing protein [Thermoanaerobaculia bacterium]|nr:DUF559 domain-containing protein [Thermoanaerobaculia bacterium]
MTLTDLARRLRRKETPAEWLLWKCVRDRRFLGLKFRRQRPFGNYILDCFCEELNLVIELDGAPHMGAAVQELDTARTSFLQSRGLTVIRIENNELLREPRVVFDRIERVVRSLRGDA